MDHQIDNRLQSFHRKGLNRKVQVSYIVSWALTVYFVESEMEIDMVKKKK